MLIIKRKLTDNPEDKAEENERQKDKSKAAADEMRTQNQTFNTLSRLPRQNKFSRRIMQE